MPVPFPGYAVPTAFAIDAGVLQIGSTLFGPSLGGIEFVPGIEWRHIAFDGLAGKIAGLDRPTGFETTLKGKFKNLTDTAISQMFSGSTSDGSTDNLWTMPAAGVFLSASTGYLADVKLLCQQSDGETFIITFPYALPTVNSITTQDKNEADIDVTFEARLPGSPADLRICPFTITKATPS